MKIRQNSCLLTAFALLMALTLSCQSIQQKSLPERENPWQNALAFAEEYLPKEGRLIQIDSGYAYLKVDDAYIHALFPLLRTKEGFREPPYFRRPNSPGAHISVVYEDEKVKLKETDKIFSFKLKDIIEVHPRKDTSYIILRVYAPELEKLRENYGLSPKLKGHEFHISLAKKER